MKSSSNRGVLNGSLQVLHVHVLSVAPLGSGNMAQSGTNPHQNRVSVRKVPHHTDMVVDLSVQTLNDIVC